MESNLVETERIKMALFDTNLFEHQFWLQILGDHSRFIFFSLAPTETEYILLAQEFILIFDQLLEQSRKKLEASELFELNQKALETAYRLREFKLELLSMSLTSDLKSHLSSSFFNDMLNELEEYILILTAIMNEQEPITHPLHYHMLWLSDAIGHASTLSSSLDLVEKDYIDQSYKFEVLFQDLYLKSLLFNGYLRTQMMDFAALERFNDQVKLAITNFIEFLENLRDQRLDSRVLGTLMPLMADHMVREECYYLLKLSKTTKTVRKPECDPTSPRVET